MNFGPQAAGRHSNSTRSSGATSKSSAINHFNMCALRAAGHFSSSQHSLPRCSKLFLGSTHADERWRTRYFTPGVGSTPTVAQIALAVCSSLQLPEIETFYSHQREREREKVLAALCIYQPPHTRALEINENLFGPLLNLLTRDKSFAPLFFNLSQ